MSPAQRFVELALGNGGPESLPEIELRDRAMREEVRLFLAMTPDVFEEWYDRRAIVRLGWA